MLAIASRFIFVVAFSLFSFSSPNVAVAACFGSEAWSRFGAVGVCVTSDAAAWAAVVSDPERVDFASPASATPVLAGGSPVTGSVDLAVISEITLDAIGEADYLDDGGVAATDPWRRLSAGALSEVFLGVPEFPVGTEYVPALPNLLSPGLGLQVGLETGVTLLLDFDSHASRPIAWAGSLTAAVMGQVSLHAVLGDRTAADGDDDLAVGIEPRIPLDSTFLGIVAPEGTHLARLQFFLRSGVGASFVMDEMAYSSQPIPEPSVALMIGAGLACLARTRR